MRLVFLISGDSREFEQLQDPSIYLGMYVRTHAGSVTPFQSLTQKHPGAKTWGKVFLESVCTGDVRLARSRLRGGPKNASRSQATSCPGVQE